MRMNKKLQCKECGKAVYGEDLYNYDGEILCRYCIVSRVYEGLIQCEYVGTCNDKTYPNKNQQINQLKQQLEDEKKLHSLAKAFYDEKQAEFDKLLYDYNKLKQQLKEKDKEIEELKQEINEWIGHKFVELKYQKAIQELEKVLTSVDVPNLSGNSQKSISLSRLRKVIQQQIKELKEKE